MKKWIWILAVALVTGVILLYIYLPGDPLVEGRRLSDWIVASKSKAEVEPDRANAVLGRLGTNRVPLLLEWLSQEPGVRLTVAERVNRIYFNAREWLDGHRVLKRKAVVRGLVPVTKGDGPDALTLATWALPQLGHEARVVAMPGLIRQLQERSGEVFRATELVLEEMTPESVGPLSECLTNRDPAVRAMAAKMLGNMGPAAKTAVPALERALTDSDELVRRNAAGSLASLEVETKEGGGKN